MAAIEPCLSPGNARRAPALQEDVARRALGVDAATIADADLRGHILPRDPSGASGRTLLVVRTGWIGNVELLCQRSQLRQCDLREQPEPRQQGLFSTRDFAFAAVAACVVDLLVATAVLLPICFWEGARPGSSILVLPLVLLWAAVLAAMVGTAAASLNVLHRDLKPLVPFLVQVWMYATPVLYPLAMVRDAGGLLAWLNPMTGVVESFRATVLHTPWNGRGAALSLASCGVVAAAALMLFLKVEADIAERV